MKALVLFESMFGNTQQIAEAIAAGIAAHTPVETSEVGTAPQQLGPDINLLVVGAPTHAFSLSRASTRRDAATKGPTPLVSAGIGVREWLDEVTIDGAPLFAAFDTRVRKPRLPGSAAKAAEKRLRHKGLRSVASAESFWVDGTTGPLLAGEIERARAWGDRLGRGVVEAAPRGQDLRL